MFRPCTLRLSNIPPVSKEVLGMSGPRGRYPVAMSLIVGTPDWVYTVGLLIFVAIVALVIAALAKYLRKK